MSKSLIMKPNQITFLALLLFIVTSCSDLREPEMTHEEVLNSVKTITTSFISHQSDTQYKDDQIISVARFYPDGTLDEMTQYMTYPYDFKEPKEQKFWASPIRANVPFVMDGLELGNAQRNLLYGNDWPRLFAKYSKSGNFPDRPRPMEYGLGNTPTIEFNELDLPTTIELMPEEPKKNDDKIFYLSSGFSQRFEYEEGKVTRHGQKEMHSWAVWKLIENEMNEAMEIAVKTNQKPNREELLQELASDKDLQSEVQQRFQQQDYLYEDYLYDGENLVSYKNGKREFKFYYENNVLIRSEYYKNGTRYNQRFYQYDDNGLITKTEIFNVNNEPEYTINYDYEYFEG